VVVFQAYQYAEGYNNTACFTNNQELRRTLCYLEFRDGENWLWYSDSVSEALNRAGKEALTYFGFGPGRVMERSRGKLVEFKKPVLRTVISEIIIDAQSIAT
jgi:hypothetical protein